MKSKIFFFLKLLVFSTLSILLLIHVFSIVVFLHYQPKIFGDENSLEIFENKNDAPNALVFGAGLNASNKPSPILEDRIVVAVDLYKSDKINKIIMTGDNSTLSHNEPDVMRDEAIRLGVPSEDIVQDYAGRKTYDSCFRAKEIFQQKKLILVTQTFHMTRAMFLCDNLGIDVTGVTADTEKYDLPSQVFWQVRDELSMLKAVYELNFGKTDVILGNKIDIDLD